MSDENDNVVDLAAFRKEKEEAEAEKLRLEQEAEDLEEIEEFIDSIPTPAELKKMTKAKLVELAEELGIEIDAKKKKADIVEEIGSKRS